MLRFLRIGLPLLWLLSLLSGVGGTISTLLLVGALAAWIGPALRSSGSASAPTKPGASPLVSSFEASPSPDAGWTSFTVYPARGQGPRASAATIVAIMGGLAAGGYCANLAGGDSMLPAFVVAGLTATIALNWVIHRFFIGAIHLSGYRNAVQAPNRFDVGQTGLRVGGALIPRASMLKFAMRNPFSNMSHQVPVASTIVVGTGALGAAAAVGSAVGSSVAQASALQRAHLLARLATHGWVLEVIDTRGNAHRLAGGMTENTLDALVHAIEQHLGA